MEIATGIQSNHLPASGATTLDCTLNLALVNGFSPAIGNSFQAMTFASRTGRFATINGTTLGNRKQFTPAYSATNLTLNVTAAAPIPALPESDGDGIPDAQELLAGTDPHDPASVLRIRTLEKSAEGVKLQFGTFAGKTYRLEYTDDLASGQWHILADRIPGTGNPATHLDPAAKTAAQRFYRLVVLPP